MTQRLAVNGDVGIFTQCVVHAKTENDRCKNNQRNQNEDFSFKAHVQNMTIAYKIVTVLINTDGKDSFDFGIL